MKKEKIMIFVLALLSLAGFSYAAGEGCSCRAIDYSGCRLPEIDTQAECDEFGPDPCLSYCRVSGETATCSFMQSSGFCDDPNFPCIFVSCEAPGESCCEGEGLECVTVYEGENPVVMECIRNPLPNCANEGEVCNPPDC